MNDPTIRDTRQYRAPQNGRTGTRKIPLRPSVPSVQIEPFLDITVRSSMQTATSMARHGKRMILYFAADPCLDDVAKIT